MVECGREMRILLDYFAQNNSDNRLLTWDEVCGHLSERFKVENFNSGSGEDLILIRGWNDKAKN